MLKGSFWVAQEPLDDTVATQVIANRYAAVLRIQHGPVTAFGECHNAQFDHTNGKGYSVFVECAVTDKLSLLGRYDYYDNNKATENNAQRVAIGGLNYRTTETLLFQANYQRDMFEEETRDPTDALLFQFKVSY